ncbi:MAG: transcription elongation factor GreB [Bacteriovoracaceae bacterium]|nr:transcription elongation factor GreB [Bacteriovoracaceae bacterium]
MKKKNYISKQGFQKLVDEFNHLTKVERPQVCATVAWAAGNGDRSENADYQYGKRRLREIDRRLAFLNKRIENAEVVHYENQQDEKIRFGATVETEDEYGENKTFTIVGVDEIDTKRQWISWESPIGRAFLGKEEGDEVLIRGVKSEYTLTIISVNYKSWDFKE